ncbi:MAG TPA: hypothetical protein VER08_07265 [Pyrinomonadaceae bacterium]|nr:hypothetical protein [Pyrinomonadaceae bacterium]
MKSVLRLSLFSFLLVACAAGVRAQTAAPSDLPAALEEGCAAARQFARVASAVCGPGGFERRHVTGDIYEYTFALRVGGGEHDRIKLHRVVRERAAGVPAHAPQAVVMVHGDLWGFDAAFLGSTLSGSVPREQSIGVYLAARGLDVWGVDLRWTQVPATTSDFSFMKDWNISTHVSDISTAVRVARGVRKFDGLGGGPVTLLGWSRGGVLAYAYANEEARMPESRRQVKALIPVDIAYRFNDEHAAQRDAACQRYAANKQLLDSGRYFSDQGTGVRAFGLLAASAPDAGSPIPGFGGLTNRQAALLVGSATHILFAGLPPVPAYHFTAGNFDASNLPVGLQFTREPYFYDFMQAAAPFQSFAEQVESEAIFCGGADVTYDDHLAEITVPVLYVGAGGGFGRYGADTLAHLGSADKSAHVVELYPAEARPVEFGHADLFLADNARDLVWAPIYDWIAAH